MLDAPPRDTEKATLVPSGEKAGVETIAPVCEKSSFIDPLPGSISTSRVQGPTAEMARRREPSGESLGCHARAPVVIRRTEPVPGSRLNTSEATTWPLSPLVTLYVAKATLSPSRDAVRDTLSVRGVERRTFSCPETGSYSTIAEALSSVRR